MILTLKKLIIKKILIRIDDTETYHKYKKRVNILSALLIFTLVVAMAPNIGGSLTTYLGLFSAGIAIAMKDIITNIAGGIFIISRKPFSTGDRIEIGDVAGDVIDIRMFQFTLMEIGNWVDADQSTGRIIHIPNSKIFTEPLSNYSKAFKYIWNEVNVLITFESDWEEAKLIIFRIANEISEAHNVEARQRLKEASKKYMIKYNKLTPIVYTDVKSDGIQLTARYLCRPRRRRSTNEVFWEYILREFAKDNKINLAYNTQRIIIDGNVKKY
jgi:small-conductance mechanosensitive channel